MDLSFLPTLNAALNGIAAVLLVVGFVYIKQRNVKAHVRCMVGAFATSAIFLVSYLTHYAWRAAVKGGVHTKYNGEGLDRTFYYGMLISHILLAMAVPVLAIVMIRLGQRKKFDTHKAVGRFAVPIWLYVSVTGVLIYVMLYHLNPQ